MSKNCADCLYNHRTKDLSLCSAPQLFAYLDGDPETRNTLTPCEGARDFKVACGHEARWFKPREAEYANAS